MTLFSGALDISISSHARWLQYADLLGMRTRVDAWNWITGEIKGNIGNVEWFRYESLGAVAEVCTRTFDFIGNSRFPPYITLVKARE